MASPDDNQLPAEAPAGAKRHWTIPRLPLLIGAIGIGAAVTTGGFWSQKTRATRAAEVAAVQNELRTDVEALTTYRQRIGALRWQGDKLRREADEERDPVLRAWAKERARRFEAFLAKLDHDEEARRFDAVRAEVVALCDRGQAVQARERLATMPVVHFPPAEQVAAWRAEIYARPLVAASRATPATYRALSRAEPELAKDDVAQLRTLLGTPNDAALSPQAMMGFELLSAVLPPDDPVVADWSAVATAGDYFEDPDAATIAQWRQAQAAVRVNDWKGAAAHMQAIDRTKIRTRLPFRAAYGKTILKNRPDDVGAAYPFLEEAARAGDAQARAVVAAEDLKQKRYTRALAWQEAALADGDKTAVEPLVTLLALPRDVLPRDPARAAGELTRIVTMPDAPPLATLLLARLYETGEGVPKSATEARALFRRAAERGLAAGKLEMARCCQRGIGEAPNAAEAGEWARQAFEAGERAAASTLMLSLMKASPDEVSNSVQSMLELETVAAPAPFEETRIEAHNLAALKTELARFFDKRGDFAKAAKLYEQAGSQDAAVRKRHQELTTVHPCEACGGSGKIQTTVPCPTCGGKGTVVCHVCDGRGYNLVPGAPPCTTCGGSGSMVQEGKTVGCAACGGTGKGKGSVVKQECTACVRGREPCRDCTGGRIAITKDCPECHGTGARALADE